MHVKHHSAGLKLVLATGVRSKSSQKVRVRIDPEKALEDTACHLRENDWWECMAVEAVATDVGVKENGENEDILIGFFPSGLETCKNLPANMFGMIKLAVQLAQRQENMIEACV